ncbi:hypothetical protein [Radiobacillus deserti]|uniref:Uncharacterized protein n=1 Tax=Radiobacillus deserti TaxID=2594883 RepID=A0A516KIB7_9BACI|nr:hypothetical protein [Radiobacillus deserti]QDP41132.1 hypothetical protein FN924_13595 [Radiobacillus deserti]
MKKIIFNIGLGLTICVLVWSTIHYYQKQKSILEKDRELVLNHISVDYLDSAIFYIGKVLSTQNNQKDKLLNDLYEVKINIENALSITTFHRSNHENSDGLDLYHLLEGYSIAIDKTIHTVQTDSLNNQDIKRLNIIKKDFTKMQQQLTENVSKLTEEEFSDHIKDLKASLNFQEKL